jgi:hypothetical protein
MSFNANIVRLHRTRKLQSLDCHIHRSTDTVIVASELSNSLDLDGLCLLPTTTVRTFDRQFDRVDFYNAAVGTPVLSEEVRRLLDTLSGQAPDDFHTLARLSLLVAVHVEREEPDVCYVGRLHVFNDVVIQLDRVTPKGEWLPEPLDLDVSSITKVEMCTRYLLALDRAVARLAK